jgi:anti-sigma B factor antagonist
VTQVRLAGEVDISGARALQQSLEGLVGEGHTRLLIDLTDVTFIDSTGLGVLLHTVRLLRRRRGRLVVLCPDPTMRGLFELVGHNMIFPVEETLEQALRRLTPSRRFARRHGGTPAQGSGSGPMTPPPTA